MNLESTYLNRLVNWAKHCIKALGDHKIIDQRCGFYRCNQLPFIRPGTVETQATSDQV